MSGRFTFFLLMPLPSDDSHLLLGQTKQTLRETGPAPALRRSTHDKSKRRMEIRAALLSVSFA